MNNVTSFKHLETVRTEMLSEAEYDIDKQILYISNRLNPQGIREYPTLLVDAIEEHNCDWLASQLKIHNCMSVHERTRRGRGLKRVPPDAHITLAHGEFNRFYMRGLCQYAIKNGISQLQVCRFKEPHQARSTSKMMLGDTLDASDALHELRLQYDERSDKFNNLALPNSGLTLCIPHSDNEVER